MHIGQISEKEMISKENIAFSSEIKKHLNDVSLYEKSVLKI